VPTEKRARQKAARQRKRAAQARKARLRKRTRSSAILLGGAAVILVLVLATSTNVFGGSSTPPTSSTTTTSTTTTKTLTSAQITADQNAANAAATAAGCPSSTSTKVNTLHWASPPPMTIDSSKTYSATVKTTAGTFVIDLLAKTAPKTVNNFVFLADQGFYHCVIFHRVVPDFMDQTGDPTGTGKGGPGYQFANENLPKSYASYDVAMANSGPNTNGSQFFIVVPGGASKLAPTYSLFGKVVSGMGVVDKINAEGNSAQTGVPPKVVQRVLTVTVHTS
jgi:cyclophilin family peptidyl-prolyl cis-trans isomerase